jgi:2-phosphosulfolactate phosphatase
MVAYQVIVDFLPHGHPYPHRPREMAVVIDILRATTTMVVALEAGATRIYPCLEVADARTKGATLASRPLLGGERRGVRIEGFDLGNSPAEYRPAAVAGREIVFSTTNGTRAIHACQNVPRVIVAGFVNLSAAANYLMEAGADFIRLVCAGTDGHVTAEDVYFAGVLSRRLIGSSFPRDSLQDATRLAIEAAEFRFGQTLSQSSLVAAFRNTLGGRNLMQLGMERDLERAADVDGCQTVPVWNPDHRYFAVDHAGGTLR